ncbi:LLM class flavin-dependent oxidoreductase [Amycolatopsis sp. NPDC101161]|uniref:LLM class flavin-dependent oxidoreductase n=1 Tax=Amycolatopsis sp. NPDC101161 TaxID=3363940 RepID=UPI00380C206B
MTRRGVVLRLRDRPAAELRRTCEVLDEAGCDTIFFEEDFTSCAAAAVLTKRVRVCCMTTSRDAPLVADAAETLHYLSDGRFILGVGPFSGGDGPYSDLAAAERVIEEVHARVPGIPVLVADADDVVTQLTKRLRTVDEASAWLAAVTP